MRPFLPLALVVVLAAHASADFKDGVYTSAEHGARFKLPKDWKLENANGENGKVATFQSADGEAKGVFRHVKEGMGASKHAKWRSVEWEKKGAAVTWDSEEKPKGREGDWLQVMLSFEAGPDEYKSAHLYFSKEKDDYELAVMIKAAGWGDAEKATGEILASLEFGEFKEEAGGEKEVLLPNPWEGYGKGSWAKYRVITENAGEKSEMEITMTLVDIDADSFTIRNDVVAGGKATPGQDQKINLKHVAAEVDAPKPEVGDEKVVVPKGEFGCHWEKTKSGQECSQVWTCGEVPGRTVKSMVEGDGSKVLMELIDFQKK